MITIDKKQAIRLGLKYYFTGKPCKNGHLSKRAVNSSNCLECSVERVYKERQLFPLKHHLTTSKNRAKTKGLDFSITEKDLTPTEYCPCCGVKLISTLGQGGNLPELASIDRINSSLGYVPGNVIIICKRCNELKSNGTLLELTRIVKWLEKLKESNPNLVV